MAWAPPNWGVWGAAATSLLVNIANVKSNDIDLLIGCDFEELLDFTDVRRAEHCRTTAKLSKFGWVIMGNTGPKYEGQNETCSSIHANKTCLKEFDDMGQQDIFVCIGDPNSCQLLHSELKQCLEADVSVKIDDLDFGQKMT